MIPTTTRRSPVYTGTGAPASYAFAFKVFSKSDLAVKVTDTAGVESTWVLDTQYTVVLNADQDNFPGGTVTPVSALPLGYALAVIGNQAYSQSTQLPNGGAYNATIVEKALDRLTILAQQVLERVSRALTLPASDGEAPAMPPKSVLANKFLGFDASGNPVPLSGTGADAGLRVDLASSAAGTLLVAFKAAGVGAVLRTLWAVLMDLPLHVKNFGALCDGATDDSAAANSAIAAAFTLGKGEVRFSGTLLASQITLKRYVVLGGDGVGSSELKQIAGSNKDFIISENFAALTGTGATVAGSALVPAHFGLANCRVNGNKSGGNTSGRGLAWYGPAQIMRGNVLVYNCAGDGIYTEDSNTSGGVGWQDEEEGRFDDVISRDNGGNGWLARGPHNSTARSITCGFNGGWGFKSEDGATYSGSFDFIGSLHTYASGRAVTPAADTGSSIGSIARISALISDGDNVDINADRVQVNSYRCFNLGGQRDGLVVNGNDCYIGSVNGNVWASSVGRTAATLVGTGNRIGALRIGANGPDNHGLKITGAHNQVEGIYLNGFTTAGRIAVDLQASKCRLRGEIANSSIAFNYGAGFSNNNMDLEISTDIAGQVPVAGATPGVTDRFSIRSSGVVVGGTSNSTQSAQFAIDAVAAGTLTVAHGLLYTPSKQSVKLTLEESVPDDANFNVSIRVNGCDATNVTIGYKVNVASVAGTLARVAVAASVW